MGMVDSTELIEDVHERKLASGLARGSYDKACDLLISNGYHIPSLEETARLRLQERPSLAASPIEGANGEDYGLPRVFRESVGTSLHFVYVPQQGVFLSKESIFSDNIDEAKKVFGRPGIEQTGAFYLEGHALDNALQDSIILIREGDIVERNPVEVLWRDLHNDPRTNFAFGEETAKEYGEFMLEHFGDFVGDNLWIWHPSGRLPASGRKSKKAYALGVSLGSIGEDSYSELNTTVPIFHHNSCAIRGVKEI